MLGQIASFMENLNMTYKEVVFEHSYRKLVIMQKDKLRVVYGEKMEEVTPEQMGITFVKYN